jgi:hypothetical protein
MQGRSLLKDSDLTPSDLRRLLALAGRLKVARRSGRESPRLIGRVVALIFEKPSTRTRCAFEVAAAHQGAQITYLDPASSHMGELESLEDTARVLGRFYDGIGIERRARRLWRPWGITRRYRSGTRWPTNGIPPKPSPISLRYENIHPNPGRRYRLPTSVTAAVTWQTPCAWLERSSV